MKGGVPIAGATSSPLAFTAVAASDAGRYSVTVSNVAGSATSREAVLTVNPPTPISFYSHPSSQTLFVGQSLNLNVSVSGSSPIAFQWQKNSAPIAGATSSSFYIAAVALSDAGSYTVALTNAAGSVTSNVATVTVNPPTAPTITTQPTGANIAFQGYISLSVQAAGSPPMTFQWKKDDVAIAGASYSNYSVSNVTPANSGVYTVTVTNSAGSTTSNGATITVAAAAAPVISTQPVDRQVAVGLSADFSINYSSSGTGNLTFQWLKDGGPIAGATSSSYSISPVREADAGDYSVLVTGAGGVTRSNNAHLTVLPPTPPAFSYSMSDIYAAVGRSAGFNVSSLNGSGPFTYQWIKNGVPISGATNASYSIASVSESDYGLYIVVVTNEGGVAASAPVHLYRERANGTTTTPWVSARQMGSIAYFLATSPARIERYDLASEQWLPTVILSETQVPTAFLPTSEGVYVAYGRTLARRSSDLATETAITNGAANITLIFAVDDFLYYNTTVGSSSSLATTGLASLRRSTLAAGPTVSQSFTDAVVAPNSHRVFGPVGSNSFPSSGPQGATVASDGRMTAITPAAN
ncbi:MAG TPA: immunoglobulin domain-containing protein, partial [Lacunisphaera sp.]